MLRLGMEALKLFKGTFDGSVLSNGIDVMNKVTDYF